MQTLSVFLLIFVAFLAGLGNLLFKKAAVKECKHFFQRFYSIPFLCGCICFLLCPVISSFCAKYIQFSGLYALTALNFVFVLLFSAVYLKEKVDRFKIGSVVAIILGIILIVFS